MRPDCRSFVPACPDGVGRRGHGARTTTAAASVPTSCRPAQNGNATLAQILLNQAFGTQPEHAEDQLGPYANLAKGYPALTNATINTFFNDASFGVPSDQVAST